MTRILPAVFLALLAPALISCGPDNTVDVFDEDGDGPNIPNENPPNNPDPGQNSPSKVTILHPGSRATSGNWYSYDPEVDSWRKLDGFSLPLGSGAPVSVGIGPGTYTAGPSGAHAGSVSLYAGEASVALRAGGVGAVGQNATRAAYLQDFATGEWTQHEMAVPRYGHTLTVLGDGRALITGGRDGGSSSPPLASTEIFDANSKTMSTTGSMTLSRQYHGPSILPGGRVLLTGGNGGGNSAEIYDPATGTFTATSPMLVHCTLHS
ncbi:MAG TPA: kelch repeat-containing protein [Longimicrobiales bacterium]|nr:kelch repeat-containing protein [Longimicrobiales bacterium]